MDFQSYKECGQNRVLDWYVAFRVYHGDLHDVVEVLFLSFFLQVFFFCLIDFSLSNFRISFIRPHGIWSQVVSSSMDPCFIIFYILESSSFIIIRNFHSPSINVVCYSGYFREKTSFFFQLIQSPIGTNVYYILLFLCTFAFTIDHFTTFKIL